MNIHRCQGRVKLQNSPSIQICLCYLMILYNQYFDDITKFFIICSLKMPLSYSILPHLQYIYIIFRDEYISRQAGRRKDGSTKFCFLSIFNQRREWLNEIILYFYFSFIPWIALSRVKWKTQEMLRLFL